MSVIGENIITGTLVLGLGALSFFSSIGATGVITEQLKAPEPYSLKLVSLDFKDNMFQQKVIPQNTDTVRARWAAQIVRGNEVICSGGGVAPYKLKITDDPIQMTPEIWTGDKGCSPKKGDKAIASWTYQNVQGLNVTISSEFILEEDYQPKG